MDGVRFVSPNFFSSDRYCLSDSETRADISTLYHFDSAVYLLSNNLSRDQFERLLDELVIGGILWIRAWNFACNDCNFHTIDHSIHLNEISLISKTTRRYTDKLLVLVTLKAMIPTTILLFLTLFFKK